MKRWTIHKTGKVILSTATGFCLWTSSVSFGQEPEPPVNEIQRRLQELYSRDGGKMPSMNMENLPKTLPNGQQPVMPTFRRPVASHQNPQPPAMPPQHQQPQRPVMPSQHQQTQPQPPQNAGLFGRMFPHQNAAPASPHVPTQHTVEHFQETHQQRALPPAPHRAVRSNPPQAVALPQTPGHPQPSAVGIRAPITGTTPALSTADVAHQSPQIVPRALYPTDEPAPPVPAIKSAPNDQPVASKNSGKPEVVPRTAAFPDEVPLHKASEMTQRHPFASREEPEEPSFEMPTMVHPEPDSEKSKAAVVLSPPIAEPDQAQPQARGIFNPFAEDEHAKTPAKPQTRSVARQEPPRPAVTIENPFDDLSNRAIPKAKPVQEAPETGGGDEPV